MQLINTKEYLLLIREEIKWGQLGYYIDTRDRKRRAISNKNFIYQNKNRQELKVSKTYNRLLRIFLTF